MACITAWLVTCITAGSCALERSATFPTATAASSSAPRRPDGVAVDLEVSLPEPQNQGDTELGLVPLREPPDIDRAFIVVRRFFRAVAGEDGDALTATMTPDATLSPLRTGGGGSATEQWERRLRRLDYRALGADQIFAESMVEVYQYSDFEDPLPGRPLRPGAMRERDVLVRVPVIRPRVGIERLFGDEIRFVLRPDRGDFRIVALYEDFQPP